MNQKCPENVHFFFHICVQNTKECLNNCTEPILGNPSGISLMDVVTQLSCTAGLERTCGSKDNIPPCLTSGVSCLVQVLSLDLGHRADSGLASSSTPEVIMEYWKERGNNVLRRVFSCLTTVSKHASVSKDFSNSFCEICVNLSVDECPSKVNWCHYKKKKKIFCNEKN